MEGLKYEIKNWASASADAISISLPEFDAIRAAKRQIIFGLGAEEKLDRGPRIPRCDQSPQDLQLERP